MIRHLIWDAGGTLFDTYPAVVEACRRALFSLGHNSSPVEILPLFRISTDYGIRTLADRAGLAYTQLAERFREAYDAIGPQYQPPFEAVREVCAFISSNGGSNFIVTHRSLSSLSDLLNTHGLADYFAGSISKDDPLPRKPDPASILALLERYQLDPRECAVVGDRCMDVEAGHAAGVCTCLYGDEPCSTLPDLRIRHYRELLAWLRTDQEAPR